MKCQSILNKRQQEILAFIAEYDPSPMQIAKKFNMAESTARHNEQKLREQTNQNSRVGLVIFYYKDILNSIK